MESQTPSEHDPVPADDGEPRLVRLNKYLADQGLASRRKCDELIASGKVSVDGETVTELGIKVDPARSEVEVDGVVLRSDIHNRRYYVLNKPRGVVCTNERREARLRAIDMIDDPDKGRIYTVGRLDEDSEGLILLTSDGDFAQQIAHPSHGVPKTYLVKVRGRVDAEALARVRAGVRLAEGRTGAALVHAIKKTMGFSVLEVTLREGLNREVRRIFAQVGYNVLSLKRVRIGSLTDRKLKRGEWRPLQRKEVESLLAIAAGKEETLLPHPGRGRSARRAPRDGARVYRPQGHTSKGRAPSHRPDARRPDTREKGRDRRGSRGPSSRPGDRSGTRSRPLGRSDRSRRHK